jgi:hypothetical protein
MGLRKDLREDRPLEERRRGFTRFVGFFLSLLAGGFALATALILTALHSSRVWIIHGETVTRESMLADLVFFIVGFVATSLLAWYWYRYRVGRRRRGPARQFHR